MQNKKKLALIGAIIAVAAVVLLICSVQTKKQEKNQIIFQPMFGNTSIHLMQETYHQIELEYRMADVNTGEVDITFYSDPEGGEKLLTDEEINWESSDTTVATVENGLVNALKPGEAVITISSEQTDCVVHFDVWVGTDAVSLEGDEVLSVPITYQGISIPFVFQPYGSLGIVEIELLDGVKTINDVATDNEEVISTVDHFEEAYTEREIHENDIVQIVDGFIYPKEVGETTVIVSLIDTNAEVIDTLEVQIIITE